MLSPAEAQRLTQRIKMTASGVRDGLFKLRNLIGEAKNSNAWSVLGFASWTAYLVDALGDEPLRVSREERQELVGYLAGEGLSVRAIAPIVGASKTAVARAVRAGVPLGTPAAGESPSVEVLNDQVVKQVTGLDGKSYSRPEPSTPRRRSITDTARDAGWEARKVAERLQRLREDDRLSRNKEEVASLLRGHLTFVIDTCQGFLDDLNQSQED